jgi:septum formation protein
VLILASRSPQRRAILRRLGVAFKAVTPDVEELAAGDATEVARENALRKALAVRAARPDDVVLGADTVVALGGALFGKPADRAHARTMLEALGGRTHTVVGGVVVLVGGERRVGIAHTQVSFRALDERVLDWYLATAEWRDRAGAYAIQGAGAALVIEVRGNYENVVGLPVATLLEIYPELLGA